MMPLTIPRGLTIVVGALLPIATPLNAQNTPASTVVAFVDVNLIPMDRERVLGRQTVIVRNGRIASIEPSARARIPSGALRVDGRGKYLMPGLAEMHAHIPGPQAPEQVVRDIFTLYIANGITTIRGMLGAPNQLTLRAKTASGEMLGPTIFVGAPSLNGNTAADPVTAARLVREHKAAGYDFLKLHPGIPRASYDSIVAAARAVGITFAGHISQGVGLEHTLASRQSTIDHLDGYIEAAVPESVRARVIADQAAFGELINAVDASRFAALAAETRKAGTWNVPTAFLWESFFSAEPPETMAKRAEMRYALPQWLTGWSTQKRNRIEQDQRNGVSAQTSARYLSLRRTLLKTLADSGARLLMGTDSPQMFNVPGFSLHHEIEVMHEAGLTPWQVLASGTRNVAEYAAKDLRLDGNFGTVTVGNRADLILLDANPLANVRNVAKRAGVMVRGRWLPASELDRMLAEMAARHASASAQPSGSAPDEREAVLAVVQRLWDGMRTRDTAVVRLVFDSAAALTRVSTRDGDARVQVTPVSGFIEALGRATEAWNERMFAPEVRIDGSLATVWTEYDFHLGSQFSHCGVDAFQLLKTSAGWKIVALSDTARREGCPSRS
jgi:imidazolonepropionase-like amidohydrolase